VREYCGEIEPIAMLQLWALPARHHNEGKKS
jgi:hypothetical protein